MAIQHLPMYSLEIYGITNWLHPDPTQSVSEPAAQIGSAGIASWKAAFGGNKHTFRDGVLHQHEGIPPQIPPPHPLEKKTRPWKNGKCLFDRRGE